MQGAAIRKKWWKRRPVVLWGAAAAACAAGATSVLLWKSWVDRTPFTATIVSASADAYIRDGGHGRAGEECTPNAAGETVVIFDKSGKHKLAEAITSRTGQRLPDSYGDFAGYCYEVTRVENVPGGEGTYKIQTGGGTISSMSEDDLRLSANEQRQGFKKTRIPADD
ncbi:hypothetical protein [Streptomyces olivoreticuli]|uniref:hypothetical protein n=1 Tax=Streptomyces olivoreticuli TaxID=68246 RepID=UPI0013C2EBE0|nr:hypothetical protein [Streptomyces olivoreticuli]